MPTVDDVMLSPDLFEAGNLLEAPSGSLFWEFNGDLYLRGHRPMRPGEKPIAVAVHLDSMKVCRLTDEDEDGLRVGTILANFDVEVSPMSALPAGKEHFEPGDFISNGPDRMIVAAREDGGNLTVVLGAPTAAGALLACRSWRLSAGGKTTFVRLDVS